MYDCNSILTTEMNNINDKDIIRAFTSLTKDLKIRGIHPGFYFIDNKESTALKLTMTTMNIKYHLVPLSNHRAKNAERAIQIFKNHFIVVMCSVDTYFHLQLWYRLLQQTKISLNLQSKSITLSHISAYTHIFG